MKVAVTVAFDYIFETEIPCGADVMEYCTSADPVYRDLCKILTKEHLNFKSDILTIIDEDNEKFLYVY